MFRRFVYLITKLGHFWARWHKEYLLGFRETHSLSKFLPYDIMEGGTVLVHEERTRCNTWKLGSIEELIRGKDQVIRGAKVRRLVKGKPEILCRPLHKRFPVESFQRTESVETIIRKEGKKAKEDVNKERNEGFGIKDERLRRVAAENVHVKPRLILSSRRGDVRKLHRHKLIYSRLSIIMQLFTFLSDNMLVDVRTKYSDLTSMI